MAQITVQEKIAELERRISELEKRANFVDARSTQRVTQTTTSGPLTAEQHGHLDSMWKSFGETFEHMGKIFR